jgi:hypothetical protein
LHPTLRAQAVRIRWRIFSFLFGFGFVAYVQQKTIQHHWHTAFLIGAGFALLSALAWLGIQVGAAEPAGAH